MNDSSCVFEIIYNTMQQSHNTMSVKTLCEMAGVSRSGYYAWVYECQLESEACARLILSHLCSFESEPPKPRSSNAPDGRSLHSYQEYMI